ncbi:hypothetical protein, partial [Chlamydia trachomatis]
FIRGKMQISLDEILQEKASVSL